MLIKEPTYKEALSHGWEIARKHKLLWIFGFFATFLGQMGILDLLVNVFLSIDRGVVAYAAWYDLPALFNTLKIAAAQLPLGVTGWAWVVWLGAFFLGIKILAIFISVTSQAALVHGVHQSMKRSRSKKPIDTDKAWHAGTGHFWPVFAINVVRRLSIVLIALLLGLVAIAFAQTAFVGSGLLFFVFFCLALFIGMALSFLAIFAVGYVVLEEQSFVQAMKSSWDLFHRHMVVSLEVGLLLLLLNVIGTLFAAVAVMLFVAQMSVFWALTLYFQSALVWSIGYVLGAFILLVLFAAIGTILTVYTTSVWTYLFVKMHKKGLKSRVLHGIHMLTGRA